MVSLAMHDINEGEEKMASIITVLKKVYKEGLEPLGFVQLKGRQPYFVRIIGGEIIQVISFRKEPGHAVIRKGDIEYDHPELDWFSVFGGIATVYRKKIDLSRKPISNHNWMKTHSNMYVSGHRGNLDMDFLDSLEPYIYKADDEESMYEAGRVSLEMTKKVFMPIFDKVNNLEECVKYMEQYSADIYLSDDKDYGWNDVQFGFNEENEGLLYIKTNNRDDFKEQAKRACEERYELCTSDITGLTLDDYEPYCKETEEWRIKKVRIRDRILDTPEIYKNAMAELERRKNANIETLRSYGLDI